MNKKAIVLLSLVVLIVGLASVSAADSDNSATTDNSGSDVATDSSSSTTAQATDTSTHTDSSVDKTSDTSTTSSSSQKTDVTSQQTTQKVTEKTQITSDTTTKASSDTVAKTTSDTASQSTQSTSQSTSQLQLDSNTTNENTNTVTEKTVDNTKSISTADENETSAYTHIVTQDNFLDYFSYTNDTETGGFTDNVIDGDILDIQGEIEITGDININKAVNITSSTLNGQFTSNGAVITIIEEGSNTNISYITLYNTKLFTEKASNITIDHFNLTNKDIQLGTNTGVFSLREGSYNITVTNSYFHTENNDGHSNVVGAGVDQFVFINNTIEGVGRVGNLFYLTSYNTEAGSSNGEVYFVNNTIIGPETPLAICIAMSISGTNVYMANNYLQYTGEGISGQWGGGEAGNNTCINNTVVGTGISLSNANMINNTADYIRVYDGDAIGNVVNDLTVNSEDSVIIANNTVKNHLTINTINYTVDESNILIGENATLTVNGTNNIVNISTEYEDNNIGNLTLEVVGSNNVIGNIPVNNYGYIRISGSNNTISNITIHKDSDININNSNNILNNINILGNSNIIINSSDNIISNITIHEDSDININSSNNIMDNTSILGDSNIRINSTNNVLSNIEINNNVIINNTGSENVFEKISIDNDLAINITGSENKLNNITVAGNTDLKVNGDSNIITNNSFVKTTTVLMNTEESQHIILLNGVNNTVTDNYLVALDLFNKVVNNGDDAVSNAENNIVHDNYGNGTLPDDNDKNYINYEVTSFEELKEVLENIKTNDTLNSYDVAVINFKDGDYTATESLTWDNATGTIDSIIFNGTDQIITAQDLTLFITVGEGYNLTINNLTLKDFDSESETNTIVNNGVLLLGNSTFDNIKGIESTQKASLISIQGNTFKNINISSDMYFLYINSIAEIVNNTFQDSEMTFEIGYFISLTGNYTTFSDNIIENITTSGVISMIIEYNNAGGDLIFENNTIKNTTSYRLLDSSSIRTGYILNNTFINNSVRDDLVVLNNNGLMGYISNNIFSNNIVSDDVIYSAISNVSIDNNTFINIEKSIYLYTQGSITNNTFINSTGDNLFSLRNPSSCEVGDNTFINCSLKTSITSIPDSNISDDFTTTVAITVDSTLNTTVNEGQVVIYINSEEYKSFDVTDGQATITIDKNALEVLTNNIEARYVSNDESFTNASTTFTLTIIEGISININDTTLYSGDTISIPVQVAVNGNLATDGYVIFKVNGKTVKDENGKTIMAYVDENGMASINYTIPDTYSNEYNISVVYSGSSGIVRSNRTITTSLKTANIEIEPITAKAGETVTLTAYITDQNGKAVNSGKLIFKLNGKTLKDANGNTLYATIENGVATLNYTIPDNYSAKDYILTAVYQGTGFERSEANNTLTLIKTTPTIVPDSTVFGNNNTITINQGTELVNIKAIINDPETNASIDTTTVVTIKINDKTVTQEYVSNGQIDMTIYTASFKNPTYNITVVVGENSQYERTSFNGTLEIVTPNGLATGSSYNGTLLVKED